MSLLAIVLTPRERLNAAASVRPQARSDDAWSPAAAPESMPALSSREWRFVFSRDGHSVDRQGQGRAAELPRADRTVLVIDELDVSWLRARLPKVRSSRLQGALRGWLEDEVLSDANRTHWAQGSTAAPADGHTWVAAVDGPWLQAQVQALQACGITVDAAVCGSEPSPTREWHVRQATHGRFEAIGSGPDGVVVWPMPMARALIDSVAPATWTVEPQASPCLADLHDIRADLRSAEQRWLQAARLGVNLLQFDLAPKAHAWRMLGLAWARVTDRSWRAVHVGLLLLLLVQLIGLNGAAWQARRTIADLEQRSAELLQSTFPSVKVVVDAPVQMERELQLLRAAVGQPSPTDLETWLDLAAPLWHSNSPPIKSIHLNGGAWLLEINSSSWPDTIVQALEQHAAGVGWTLRVEGARLTLAPGKAKG